MTETKNFWSMKSPTVVFNASTKAAQKNPQQPPHQKNTKQNKKKQLLKRTLYWMFVSRK